jgi:hypothetical protein
MPPTFDELYPSPLKSDSVASSSTSSSSAAVANSEVRRGADVKSSAASAATLTVSNSSVAETSSPTKKGSSSFRKAAPAISRHAASSSSAVVASLALSASAPPLRGESGVTAIASAASSPPSLPASSFRKRVPVLKAADAPVPSVTGVAQSNTTTPSSVTTSRSDSTPLSITATEKGGAEEAIESSVATMTLHQTAGSIAVSSAGAGKADERLRYSVDERSRSDQAAAHSEADGGEDKLSDAPSSDGGGGASSGKEEFEEEGKRGGGALDPLRQDLFELNRSTQLLSSLTNAVVSPSSSASVSKYSHSATPSLSRVLGGESGVSDLSHFDPSQDHVYRAIVDAVLKRPGLKPHAATQALLRAPPAYLHELDKQTVRVVEAIAAILLGANTSSIGSAREGAGDVAQGNKASEFPIPESDVPLRLSRRITIVELKGMQRLFVRNNSTSPLGAPIEIRHITTKFVEEINAWLQGASS